MAGSRQRYRGTCTCAALAAVVSLCVALASQGEATILRFDTTLGDIDVRMFEAATPASVANFLNYVNDDDYDGTFFHRMPRAFDDQGNVGTFVLQGGGFSYTAEGGLKSVPTDAPVINEPGISNLKYTLAYAKLGGDPNSATSGFFFNTQNNANNLDNQNGGFTVFGRVVGGFDVLDTIASLTAYDLDGSGQTFDTVPLLSNTGNLEDVLVYLNDVTLLNLSPGDYNFDGRVNLTDYSIWRDKLGSTTLVAADGNGNGIVDAADYAIWKSNLGQQSGLGASVASVNVPEPTGQALIAGALLFGGTLGWRSRPTALATNSAKKAGLE